MAKPNDLLVLAQIGDLHITSKDTQTYADFRAIVEAIGTLSHLLDFVFVPGDVANFGKRDEYRLVAPELARLATPVHVISGDHDMNEGGLAHFYKQLGVDKLPYAAAYTGVRCLFLDMCGAGDGQLDFQLGRPQSKWLREEIAAAARDGQRCAVFMHTYPDDLTDPVEKAATVTALAAEHVRLVAIGHTHYNELANDGGKIFAATRSTGQIEEGAVGFSLATIDGDEVSWRFRRIADDKPLVMITQPADRRLATASSDTRYVESGTCDVRAIARSAHGPVECVCRIDGGRKRPMQSADGIHFAVSIATEGARFVTVEARDETTLPGSETIELTRPQDLARFRHANGSDADRLGRWIERGILGSQLGPNRNGKAW